MACNNHNESWNWAGDCLQNSYNLGMSECIWNDVTTNQEDISYMFDETTPVKACGNLAYHVDRIDSSKDDSKVYKETHCRAKRRRILQFDTQATDTSLRCEEISSTFLRSNEREDAVDDASQEVSQWVSGFSDASASSYDGMDQSSDGWLADCFKDMEVHFSPEDINANFPGSSDVQIDISEHYNGPPEFGANVVQKRLTRTPNIIFKGRTSYIKTPTKLATPVMYPFDFIKPSEAQGDVTLKDINQRILTPSTSIAKQSKEESPASYPTSAFSGKPVVGKTKIRTEGGKGSIIIMRTKG